MQGEWYEVWVRRWWWRDWKPTRFPETGETVLYQSLASATKQAERTRRNFWLIRTRIIRVTPRGREVVDG